MARHRHGAPARVAAWWRVVAVVGVLAAVAGWGTAVVRWGGDSQADGEKGAPERAVAITAPQADERVAEVEQVSGTSRDLQGGEAVWILVRRSGANKLFFPAWGPCVSTGNTWTCPQVRIGEAAATGGFVLVPIVVGGEGQRVLIDYLLRAGNGASGPGMTELPQGLLEQGPEVAVSRGG